MKKPNKSQQVNIAKLLGTIGYQEDYDYKKMRFRKVDEAKINKSRT